MKKKIKLNRNIEFFIFNNLNNNLKTKKNIISNSKTEIFKYENK